MDGIPLLSVKQLEGPSDYIRYRNCIACMKQKSKTLPPGKKLMKEKLELMEKVGMKNYSKFSQRRISWNNLQLPIPFAYLDGIGVDRDVLNFCLELDIEEYKQALSFERKIEHFGFRAAPCIYISHHVPEEFQEEQMAIKYIHEWMIENKAPNAWVVFTHIVSHFFNRENGYVGTNYYYPTLKIEKDYLIPTASNENCGIVRI